MSKFDWEKFKNEKIAVEVLSREECKEFLSGCDKNGMHWNDKRALLFIPFTPTAICYGYSRKDKLGYSRSEFFSKEGYKIVSYSDVKLQKEEIIIYKNNAEVVALHKENGKIIKSAKAICCPEDKFDFNIGAKLAFDRLINGKEDKQEHLSFKVGEFVKVKGYSGVRHFFPMGSSIEIKSVDEKAKELRCYGYIRGFGSHGFSEQAISMTDVMKISK